LRRFVFPDAELDEAKVAMLICDMLHCIGQPPRQLPTSVLSCICMSNGIAHKPWNGDSSGACGPASTDSTPRLGLESRMRQILEAAREQLKARKYQEAQQLAAEAMGLDPNNPTALHILGMTFHQSGKREKA